VPVKYSPKEKIWYWLNERKDDETLPIISVGLTGVDYALERAGNKHQKLTDTITTSAGSVRQFLNPAPYDLTFSVSIWALYMSDIDQIIEQILPYFQPNVIIRVYIPELSAKYDVKVIFNSASPEWEFEMSDEMHRVLKYTLDFTVQTYMFKPMETTGIIRTILLNYYQSEASFNARAPGNSNSTFTSGASGESQRFRGVNPWLEADGDPIYDYELFQGGSLVGSAGHYGHPAVGVGGQTAATHVFE
jgi:hypothetical protein